MTLGVIVVLALVLANGCFVATEFARARLRLTKVSELESTRRPGSRSARHTVEHIDAYLDAYLAACQLGITLASIGLGVVGKPAFASLLRPLLSESSIRQRMRTPERRGCLSGARRRTRRVAGSQDPRGRGRSVRW